MYLVPLYYTCILCISCVYILFIKPAREARWPEGLRAESAKAFTGRRGGLFGALAIFVYEYSCNSETKRKKSTVLPRATNRPLTVRFPLLGKT